MKKLFQILFFVLCPLIIYSQETLRNESDSARTQLVADTNHLENRQSKSDSTRKPYFESVTLSAGIVDGSAFPLRRDANLIGDVVVETVNGPAFPLRMHVEKRLGKKNLLTIGCWRTAFSNVDGKSQLFPKSTAYFDIEKGWDYHKPFPLSNWTLEVDYHRMLVERKFTLSVYSGYGFEFADSWYLGGSMHMGINASYPITPRLRFTLVTGSRFMHLGVNDGRSHPYHQSIVMFANAGIKWIFTEDKRNTRGISKYFNALRPSRKLGVGIVLGVGEVNDRDTIKYYMSYTTISPPETLYLKVGYNPPAHSRPYSFPYLQFTIATKKLHFHNIGFGFKKISFDKYNYTYEKDYTENNTSFRIYYQSIVR